MEKTRNPVYVGRENVIQAFLNLLKEENDHLTYQQLLITLDANKIYLLTNPDWFIQGQVRKSKRISGIELEVVEVFAVSLMKNPWEQVSVYEFEMEDGEISVINYGIKK